MSSAQTKAAYLAKHYLSGPPAKKKAKKKKRATGGVRVVDVDDDGWTRPKTHRDEEDDDDAPVVVYDTEKKDTADRRARGAWKAVPAAKETRADSDDDLSPPRRQSRADSDLSPPRRRADSDLSPPRRQSRLDSDDDDLSPPRRQNRLDSDDDDLSPPRRQRRVDSDDLSPPRRQHRVDSDLSPPRKQTRMDSDLSPPRRRVDSDEDKPAVVVEEERPGKHSAGLMSGASFKEAEKKLRAEREAAAAATASAGQDETVYRDRKGRKLDMLNEFMRLEAEREGKKKQAREEFEWGKGSKQKRDVEDANRELEAMKYEPFARTKDDPKLEKMLKETIRDGDPMQDWFATNGVAHDHAAVARKPVYKGPTPPPNRYGIAPGYRWDGVDRGNGWEAKRQARQSNLKATKQQQRNSLAGL